MGGDSSRTRLCDHLNANPAQGDNTVFGPLIAKKKPMTAASSSTLRRQHGDATIPLAHTHARNPWRRDDEGPRLTIQAKLKVGAVNDPLEQEADRVVERVMRMPDREVALGSAPQVSRQRADCGKEEQKLHRLEDGPQ